MTKVDLTLDEYQHLLTEVVGVEQAYEAVCKAINLQRQLGGKCHDCMSVAAKLEAMIANACVCGREIQEGQTECGCGYHFTEV